MKHDLNEYFDTGGPALFPGMFAPGGRLACLGKGGSKSTSTTQSTTTAVDSSLNAAAGATVVGSGGTLINQRLDADVAREALQSGVDAQRIAGAVSVEALRTGEEVSRAALDTTGRAVRDSLAFADSQGFEAQQTARQAVDRVADVSRDSIEFADRAIGTVADTTERLSERFAIETGRASKEVVDLASQLHQVGAQTAESITRTAIENLEKNKRDPDSDVLQVVAKWAAVAVAAVFGLVLMLRPSPTPNRSRR